MTHALCCVVGYARVHVVWETKFQWNNILGCITWTHYFNNYKLFYMSMPQSGLLYIWNSVFYVLHNYFRIKSGTWQHHHHTQPFEPTAGHMPPLDVFSFPCGSVTTLFVETHLRPSIHRASGLSRLRLSVLGLHSRITFVCLPLPRLATTCPVHFHFNLAMHYESLFHTQGIYIFLKFHFPPLSTCMSLLGTRLVIILVLV